ncbi:helix-turn-helix domain-containing protein [Streptomyces mutabilis]|uniref:helix-turn-helix domain-containing protein n=1 Tax=Streptomyces mutabilis TaxID=67332 RepID=UPI0022BA3CDD|nr:helix-turn-helix domain-containing protein [Streptomyces mutabilis]MCZ9353229.1 helix-turn-helix domain-containing protein [Streptomyces mutabilis]
MAAMSRATRRIVVAHLTDRGMSPAEIASELGVSRDTVRRDLADAPPPAPVAEPEPAAPVAAGLLLPDGAQLQRNLAVLTAAYKGARPEDAARFAIHQAAQGVRRYWRARAEARRRSESDEASGSPRM